MLAIHLDNILFLLFVAVAVLFQLLTRAATKTGRRTGGDPTRRSTSPPPPRREETEEDRIRKFLEALGQPTTSRPPPPVAPRTDIPPRPVAPIQPPPSMRPFSFPTRQLTQEERRKSVVILEKTELPEVHSTPPPPEPITETEGRASFEPPAQQISRTESRIDIATLLRTTSGLRQAILLREIFGPPRSLQPLDLVGTV